MTHGYAKAFTGIIIYAVVGMVVATIAGGALTAVVLVSPIAIWTHSAAILGPAAVFGAAIATIFSGAMLVSHRA